MKPMNWIAAIAVGVALLSIFGSANTQPQQVGRYQISAVSGAESGGQGFTNVYVVDTVTSAVKQCRRGTCTDAGKPF
jgi:hypothetical protein